MKTILTIPLLALALALSGCNGGSDALAALVAAEAAMPPAVDLTEAQTGTAPTDVCPNGTLGRASFKTLDEVILWYQSFVDLTEKVTCTQILYIAPSHEVISWWYVELMVELAP